MSTLPRPTPIARAFTLVELLVVIAVIALLVGILLPSLGAAREAGRTVACLSNVRQLEVAHTLYMNDFKERFIDVGLPHGQPLGRLRRAWPVVLAEYGGPGLALRSPSDRSPYWAKSQGGTSSGLTLRQALERLETNQSVNELNLARWTSYGLNDLTTPSGSAGLTVDGQFRRLAVDRLSLVPRPYAVVHFLQMTQGVNPGGDLAGQFARSDHLHPMDWEDLVPENPVEAAAVMMDVASHGGTPDSRSAKANYGFLDGHARTLTFGEVYRTRTDNLFVAEFAK
jgi:prepilin-type N-terminal cleavage/methylation domain-containing protein/prepilin-type processing-associated H-X9-DG protein